MRHEIVHNKNVVENLKKKGAIFVEELSEIKDISRPVIFSAHGVPKNIPEEARKKNIFFIDATFENRFPGPRQHQISMSVSPLGVLELEDDKSGGECIPGELEGTLEERLHLSNNDEVVRNVVDLKLANAEEMWKHDSA